VTSLPDDSALHAIALDQGGLVEIMRPGAVHISMTP
jgi:3-hydroxyisobutyrate dehydrogenase-like beta-hydroxyacid dehydrogenase